ANAQPTARVRLRKSRRINEGCANCSMLFSIDTHESPFGSIPPVAPALAISSAGFAPSTAEHEKVRKAMAITILATRSARRRRRLGGCAAFTLMELADIFCFRVGRSRRMAFDIFILLESSI